MVALVAAPGTPPAVRALVRALGRHVTLRSAGRASTADAVLASSPRAGGPLLEHGCRAVVDGDVVHVAGPAGAVDLALPAAPGVDTAALPPLAPHVRARWRLRLGLPATLAVDVTTLAAADVPTALAVASAAVVPATHLPLALALGCPTVTSADAAAGVGAADGLEVVVGERSDADALAADLPRSAALSRRARALAERALDPDATARALVAAWGLAASPLDPGARVEAAFTALGTAPGAPIRRRAAEALAPLVASGGR